MIFSSLASIGLVNNAEASVSGNISIVGSFPSEFDYIPAYEPTYFTVELTNVDTVISEPRTINWYVCLGEEVTNICISQKLMMGQLASRRWQRMRLVTIPHRMPFIQTE